VWAITNGQVRRYVDLADAQRETSLAADPEGNAPAS